MADILPFLFLNGENAEREMWETSSVESDIKILIFQKEIGNEKQSHILR
jgi:hypothetical protein